MVTASLQLSEVAANLASSELSGNLGGLTVSSLLVSDGGSKACVLGC
jgi:hypothetical protein